MGATGTVTGSKFLLEGGGSRTLVDCGLFQGRKALRERNWKQPPVDPASVHSVVLTHAHVDHTGYLPRFVSQGFRGPVYATAATVDLCRLLLPDAAHLQEEEARYRNKHRLSKHHPALPLYTADDAQKALELLTPLPYWQEEALSGDLAVEFYPAGHILGSAFAAFRAGGDSASRSILFTGDIGRYDQPIVRDPSEIHGTDYLVLESTYGNRLHGMKVATEGKSELRRIILETIDRDGSVLIPSFAIGRAQEILYILRELEEEDAIPVLPVFVDSPMAINAFDVFERHRIEHDAEMRAVERGGGHPLSTRNTRFTRTPEESKQINACERCIIISASGMATGGRILHHLTRRIVDERNSVVFVGFQAAGTRGRTLVDGGKRIRIFGIDWPVRAAIHRIEAFSAHGDYGEIVKWLSLFKAPPRKIFLVHGEAAALEGMRNHILETFPTWNVVVPEYLDAVEL